MKGFTLIELAIVIGIAAILIGVGFLNISNYKSRQELTSTVQQIVAVLRNAQDRSLAQEGGGRWGVHFENSASGSDFYVLFKGTSYATGVIDTKAVLPSSVQFDEPSDSTSIDVIFSPITGLPDAAIIIKLSLISNPEITETINIGSSGTINYGPPAPPIASFAFNEGSGPTTIDSSGDNDGTLVGATWTASGKYSNAISFDGVNDKVTLPSSFDFSLPLTIEAWIRPTNRSDYHAIFSKRDYPSVDDMRFDLGLNITSGRVYVYTGVAQNLFTYAPALNNWTHLAVTADSAGTNLYVNGVLNETMGVITLGADYLAKVAIGNTGDDDDPFAGRIDELRIYDRVLTQSEIQADMNRPL